MSEVGVLTALAHAASGREETEAFADAARPAMFRGRLRLIALIAVLLGVQIELVLLVGEEALGILGYGLAHLLSCLAAWSVRRWISTPDGIAGRSDCVLQIVILTLFAGPFGTVISGGLLMPAKRDHRPMGSRDAAPTSAQGAQDDHGAPIQRRRRPQNGHGVRPLLDVIAEGTQAEKFEALRVIAKLYEPALAPTLRYALGDSSAPVRVLAATVMAKLRMVHLEKVVRMQTEVACQPGRPQPLRKLARARLDLAESGLLDAPRVRVEVERAREEFATAAALDCGTAP